MSLEHKLASLDALPKNTGVLKWFFVLLVILALVCLAVYEYIRDRGQLFVVEARTLSATLVITRDTTWYFKEYTLCERREKRDLQANREENQICDPILYEYPEGVSGRELTFQLKAGSKVELKALNTGYLQVRFIILPSPTPSSSGQTLDMNDRLLISEDSWKTSGALGAEGGLIIGETVSSGSSGYLLDGRYAIWEDLLSKPLTGSEPVEVKSGTLRYGDVLSLDRESFDLPEQVLIFIAPAQDELDGFQVGATSRPDVANLTLKPFGANESTITATWLDRIFLDAFTAGIITILAAIFAITRLLYNVVEFFHKKNGIENQATARLNQTKGNGYKKIIDHEQTNGTDPDRESTV